jgi:hypothetical protein
VNWSRHVAERYMSSNLSQKNSSAKKGSPLNFYFSHTESADVVLYNAVRTLLNDPPSGPLGFHLLSLQS